MQRKGKGGVALTQRENCRGPARPQSTRDHFIVELSEHERTFDNQMNWGQSKEER